MPFAAAVYRVPGLFDRLQFSVISLFLPFQVCFQSYAPAMIPLLLTYVKVCMYS